MALNSLDPGSNSTVTASAQTGFSRSFSLPPKALHTARNPRPMPKIGIWLPSSLTVSKNIPASFGFPAPVERIIIWGFI